MKEEKYHIVLRILHWSMAVIIIGLLISGFTKGYWPKDIRPQFYFWHKSFGLLVIVLFVLRVMVKLLTKEPELPKELGKFSIFGARAGWAILYVFMIALPLSGYIPSDAGGRELSFFGISVPDLIPENKPLARAIWYFHETLPWFFVAIIALHVLAALKHYFLDKINLFSRMV